MKLRHKVNFSCGRKPEYPEKTYDFRQSVDILLTHKDLVQVTIIIIILLFICEIINEIIIIIIIKTTENLPTSQGYIFYSSQHFTTKLCNFTKSRMLFQAVVIFFPISIFLKSLLKGHRSINYGITTVAVVKSKSRSLPERDYNQQFSLNLTFDGTDQ